MFSQPFGSRWIFDVELLARLICLRRETIEFPAEASIFELPLESWEDVKGSKLKRGRLRQSDCRAGLDLVALFASRRTAMEYRYTIGQH